MGEGGVPLLCLPPAPHTGAYFESVLTHLAESRTVIAVDYPGYGGSDRLLEPATIQAYAKRIAACFDDVSELDLLGFHTGNLVAAEIAKGLHETIRKAVMIDVPCFDKDTRVKYAAGLSDGDMFTSIKTSFEKSVLNRDGSMSEERALTLWGESLRSGTHKNDAFRAAFNYDCTAEFQHIDIPITMIATKSSLLNPTREAAKLIPHAVLVEALHIVAPVFEAHIEEITRLILEA